VITTAGAVAPMGTYGHTLMSMVQRMVAGRGVAGAHKLPRGFQVAANKYRAWQFFLLESCRVEIVSSKLSHKRLLS
jgi:hypothetical protein